LLKITPVAEAAAAQVSAFFPKNSPSARTAYQ